MRTLREDDLIVKLHRGAMERDLEQLHRKLDEFEKRLAESYPAAGAPAKPRRQSPPHPLRP
jgi:uncharacterized coiled-coil protein SlyX